MNIEKKGTLINYNHIGFCGQLFRVLHESLENYLRTGKHSFTIILNLGALTNCLKQECQNQKDQATMSLTFSVIST